MQIYIRFFAIFNLLNGIIMLIWPEPWYDMTYMHEMAETRPALSLVYC